MLRAPLIIATVLLLTAATVPGTAAAVNQTTPQETPGQEEPGEEGEGIDIGGELQEAVISVMMDSVQGLAETVNSLLTRIFVSYPDVKQSSVMEIHQKVFQVSLALASAAAAWIGILHMFNRVDGIRPLISLLGAVAFGAVAPSLLSYSVELSRLTTEALAPANTGIIEVSKFTFELFLVLLIDVSLLLGTVMIFVARDIILMTGVALSPLIALMAVTPPLQRFSDRLISIWIACLIIGPLDVVIQDLTLSLMGSSIIGIPHFLWGLGGIALLFGLPLILLGAGAIVFAPMTRVTDRGAGKAWRGAKWGWKQVRDTDNDESDDRTGEEYDSGDRGNRFRRRGGDD